MAQPGLTEHEGQHRDQHQHLETTRADDGGLMLMTAGAGVTGVLGATAPANAANDASVAVAIGLVNDAPPVTTVGGLSINADQDQAYQGALSDCVSKGGHQCVVEAVIQNGCGAAASNDVGEMVGATEITLRRAQDNARGKLQNQQRARIVASGCSNGADAEVRGGLDARGW